MADDNVTLLTLKADASQLKAEVASARDAVKQASADIQAAASQQVTLGPRGQAQAATIEAFGFSAEESAAFAAKQETANILLGKGADTAKEFGKQVQLSKRDLNDLAGGLALVSPQLGGLARMAINAKEALGVMFTPVGAGIAAGSSALALFIGLLQNATNELERATQAADTFAQQQERIRQAGVEVERGVSKELARQGKGSEAAFTAATSAGKRLEEAGFEKSTAAQVAAALTGEGGEDLVAAQDFELFAAGVERGDIDLGGKNDRERARNLRKAQRFVDRNRDSLMSSSVALRRPRQRQAIAAREGQTTEAAQIGEEVLGLSPKEAAQAAKDLREMEQRDVTGGFEDEGRSITHYAESTDVWVNRLLGGPVDVPLLGKVGRSERVDRIRRASDLKAAVEANARRRESEAIGPAGGGGQAGTGSNRIEALLEQVVDAARQTAAGVNRPQKPPSVNMTIGSGHGPPRSVAKPRVAG